MGAGTHSSVFCSATQHISHIESATDGWSTLYPLLILHTNESAEKGSAQFFKVLGLFPGLFVVRVASMSLWELRWATTLEQERDGVGEGRGACRNWVRTNKSPKLSNGLLLPSLWVQTSIGMDKTLEKELTCKAENLDFSQGTPLYMGLDQARCLSGHQI